MNDDRQPAVSDAMKEACGVGWQTWTEVKELPRILCPGELPLKVVRSFYDGGTGLLVATERRLVFVIQGITSLKVEDFEYDKITSVQYRTDTIFGEIQLVISAHRATFKNIEKTRVPDFGDWLRARISAPKEAASPASTPRARDEIFAPIAHTAKSAKIAGPTGV